MTASLAERVVVPLKGTARERDDGLPLVAVCVAVALLPLLRPKGPGHTAPVDLFMAAAVIVTLLWAGSTVRRLHLPYVIPVGGLVIVGTASAFASTAPLRGLGAVLQELFLLAWCAAVMNVCRTPRGLSVVLRTWAWSAVGWATFLVAAAVTNHKALAGINGTTGGRAQLTFDHPNLAASYFLVGLFVVALARCPRHPLARAAAYVVLLGALLLAGSNAALFGVVLGALVAVFIATRRKEDLVVATATVLGLLLVGGVLWVYVEQPAARAVESSNNSLVRYSVARGGRSAEARQSLFRAEYELFRTGGLLGRGPASTKVELADSQAIAVKEAHDDYLATLVERGVFGAVALLFLIGSIAIRAASIDVSRLSYPFARVVPGTAALVGVLVAMANAAVTHETLHYRHLWALLGVLAALYTFARRSPTGLEEVTQ